MKHEMRDLRVLADAGRLRLVYDDEAGRVHELASAPDCEKGKRWLENIAADIRRDLSGVR